MNNRTQSKPEKTEHSDLFYLAPVGYFILEREGLILNVNLAGAAELGADRQALIKRNFSDHVSTEDRGTYNLHRERVLETRVRQKCELKLRRADGTEFYAQMISTAPADERQEPDKLLSAVLDITERKKVEHGLQVSQDRYRDLVEATTDWVWEVDAQGTYTYASPKV
ncbi:MAG: PAS domain-containing protein, partial [Planctomycetota bacterium]